MAQNQFRSDLYYRLNVFPVTVPPLRERKEDIPLLVRYFAQKYARRMKRRIDTVPAKAMTALTEYHWPGNVRELENFIERAVILSPGTDLHVPLSELKPITGNSTNGAKTLEGIEREHILKILRQNELDNRLSVAYRVASLLPPGRRSWASLAQVEPIWVLRRAPSLAAGRERRCNSVCNAQPFNPG